MKVNGTIGTAFLCLLFGIAAPVFAQHEQKDEKQNHPVQQQSRHEQAQPQPQHAQQQSQRAQQQREQPQQHAQQQQRQDQNNRQQHAQQQQRQDQNNRQQHAQQQQRQNQNNQQQRAQQQRHDQNNRQARGTPEQHRVQQSAWQSHGSRNWDSDHRNWQQRGGYRGYRVPDDRYRGYFGPNHGFRIGGLPFLVVGGYPRFQYDGYWISAVDPWPEYWGADWYDNDDVYVAYVDNGYYMYNRRYPTAGVAISISF